MTKNKVGDSIVQFKIKKKIVEEWQTWESKSSLLLMLTFHQWARLLTQKAKNLSISVTRILLHSEVQGNEEQLWQRKGTDELLIEESKLYGKKLIKLEEAHRGI